MKNENQNKNAEIEHAKVSTSGLLASPHGYWDLPLVPYLRKRVPNGWPIEDGRLKGYEVAGKVPRGFIEPFAKTY